MNVRLKILFEIRGGAVMLLVLELEQTPGE